ncbi:MAG: penicillin-binding protein activator [Gammaproteobacteria bacterium]
MQATRNRTRIAFAFLLAALCLSACEPGRMMRPETQAERNAALADARMEAGEFAAAAELYERLAEGAPAAERNRYRLAAADAWWEAGEVERTRTNLTALEGELTAEELQIQAPLAARVDLARGHPERALQRLAQLPRKLPQELLVDVLEIEGTAHFRAGQTLRGIEVLVEREAWLESRDDVLDNHRLIWNSMLESRAEDLPPETAAEDPVIAGWLSLGQAAFTAGRNASAFREQLEGWRETHPDHPAGDALLQDILRSVRTVMRYPQQVALLLPLSGREAAAASALRDGFLAAWFTHESEAARPRVQVYDVAERNAKSVYSQAVLDGADFIVGPLTKTSVQEVVEIAGEVPTLVLNYLPEENETAPPPMFFQFALAPEDEARQAAARALADGHRRAIAFVPNNDWGFRVLRSFAGELESEGGVLLDFRAYDTGASDFSEPIVKLLGLDMSLERHARLAAELGVPLAFQPQPREDIDFLFLATTADHARLIRPQLRFHFAANLPVYSTSAAYDPARESDSDLNGIMFADMPWTISPDAGSRELQETLKNFWPARADRWARLYAMGYDAYRLVPLLHGEADPLRGTMPGLTGVLSMDERGRIHRDLEWAQFRGGKPQELATVEATASLED